MVVAGGEGVPFLALFQGLRRKRGALIGWEGGEPHQGPDLLRVVHAVEEALSPKVEAHIVQGGGEEVNGPAHQAQKRPGKDLQALGQTVRLERLIAHQQLVTPVAAQGHGHVLTGEPGEQVRREDGGVGQGLVQDVSHLGQELPDLTCIQDLLMVVET